ncbi:ScbA/BarX family gamma-butyrolactone biosynthesis protein [Streptomyces sp. NPDC056568]|uniref:ScbA/BarX family gamma-butyrolactone biosynthesis protein n=1 Tax=Streptomyces sp. NPDC056568 TaxID=3345866 RepID=UPI0036C22DF9
MSRTLSAVVPDQRTRTGARNMFASTRLTTTVPREYVHRAAVSEVFLTHWEADSPDRFSVTAQWPRAHALFVPVGGYQDPLLLVESVRQTGALLAHAQYEVPFGHQFLMWHMSFDARPEALVAGPRPTEVVLRAECGDITRRGGKLAGMEYHVTVERDGAPLATATAAFSCTSPSVYRRLRGDRTGGASVPLPVGIVPESVGRQGSRDVVLAAADPHSPHRWQLRVDTAHPVFFDHPVDHVPGMVLLEAARQAAHAATDLPDALPVGLESAFARYAELDAPCWIDAEAGRPDSAGRVPTTVRGTQNGKTVFTATVVLCPTRTR